MLTAAVRRTGPERGPQAWKPEGAASVMLVCSTHQFMRFWVAQHNDSALKLPALTHQQQRQLNVLANLPRGGLLFLLNAQGRPASSAG